MQRSPQTTFQELIAIMASLRLSLQSRPSPNHRHAQRISQPRLASTTTPRALFNQRTQSVPRHFTPVVIDEQVRGLPFYSQCQCDLNFALRHSRKVSSRPGPQTDSTIPTCRFQAHAFTIANNVTWILGRCSDSGRFKEVWCFIGACARDKSSSLWWANY